jgi:hypothetical protein
LSCRTLCSETKPSLTIDIESKTVIGRTWSPKANYLEHTVLSIYGPTTVKMRLELVTGTFLIWWMSYSAEALVVWENLI